MTGLYIHIPFCHRKCLYCSFVVSVGQRPHVDSYLDCLNREANFYKDKAIETIYIGGGTPTFLKDSQLERLFRIIQENFQRPEGSEFTVEANPEGLDLSKLKLMKNFGVNRLSLGMQSLSDRYLKYLGRNHHSQMALEAFKLSREAGFSNINVDLMYGFPDQTEEELRQDINRITALASEHVSVYYLTVEEPSRFFIQKVRQKQTQRQAEEYLLVKELLEASGLKQYEVSNFAIPGKESLHNLYYWQGREYIGLGVGAHSHLEGRRFWNVARLKDYLECLKNNQLPTQASEILDPQRRFLETLLIGLRMNEGIVFEDLEKRFSTGLDRERLNILEGFLRENFLRWEGKHLKATAAGQLVLDELSARLI